MQINLLKPCKIVFTLVNVRPIFKFYYFETIVHSSVNFIVNTPAYMLASVSTVEDTAFIYFFLEFSFKPGGSTMSTAKRGLLHRQVALRISIIDFMQIKECHIGILN